MMNNVNHGLNLGLHSIILFTFLTTFFFLYVSKLERESINSALNNIINDQVNNFLNTIDESSLQYDYTISWQDMKKLAEDIITNTQKELPEITKNNKKIFYTAIFVIISLFLFWIGCFVYFKYKGGYGINMTKILMNNLIIFIFIGILEYWFFTRISAKYIPVTPSDVEATLIDKIRRNVVDHFSS